MVIELHGFLIDHSRDIFVSDACSQQRCNAMLKFSTGHVIDHVSNDVQRLEEEAIKLFFSGSFTVVEVVLSSLLLDVYLIGWQALMGVIFLCTLVPYFFVSSFVGAALRKRLLR